MKNSNEYINKSVFKVNQDYTELQNKTKELFFKCLDERRTLDYFKQEVLKIWGNVDHSYMWEELENYEEALKQELILYDLGKSEGLDLQQKTIDILLSNSVEMTHDNQEKDEVFEENRPLDDSRVTDRATIVVKKGTVRPFDKDE